MNGKLGVTSVAVLLAFVAALSAPRVAHAQRSPDTATLDRGDGVNRFGLDFGLTFLEGPPVTGYDAALRFEPYGQWVSDSGVGIYGSLPFARSFGDGPSPTLPEPRFAIGNLELGALFVTSGETASWVFRGGIAFPTGGDSPDSILTNIAALEPRFTDLALAVPNAAYVRLALSPLFHTSNLFLRFDLGFDLGIDTNDDMIDPDHFLRLNVGGGVDLGAVALGLELVNLGSFDDDDDNEFFAHDLAVTIRFMGEALQPVLAIGTPLDDDSRDRVNLFLAFGIQFLL